MDYLAKVNIDGVIYEAHVDVREYDGELEAWFSTTVAYVNDDPVSVSKVHTNIQDALLDEAYDMYRMDDGADAAYDAMRDA